MTFDIEGKNIEEICDLIESLLIVGEINKDTEVWIESLTPSQSYCHIAVIQIEADDDGDLILSLGVNFDHGVRAQALLDKIRDTFPNNKENELWYWNLYGEPYIIDQYEILEDNILVFSSKNGEN